jgi:hypothetical protein
MIDGSAAREKHRWERDVLQVRRPAIAHTPELPRYNTKTAAAMPFRETRPQTK